MKHEMNKWTNFFLIFVSILFLLTNRTVLASSGTDDPVLLLSRLNLDAPGMEKVKAATDPQEAIKELWSVYRNGGAGKHPVSREDKRKSLQNYASARDFELADDAMKHILCGAGGHPSFFRGEEIDWINNPVADSEWIWQLNRMGFWNAMAKVYWHTGDEKYAAEWVRQFLQWTKNTPNDRQHANAWRSIEAGIRGYAWMSLFQHFLDSPHFTPEVLTSFLNSCYDHAAFLMKKYSKSSNWALMEAEGMAYIAIMFPQFKDAEAWRKEAFRRLNAETSIQVYPDGHQRELCMGYHVGCINWFFRTFELAKMNNLDGEFDPNYLKTIEKMCEVPMKISFPDGRHTQFGDDSRGQPGQERRQYRHWAALFNRPDFLYIASEGKEGICPEQTANALPQSGLYSFRNTWASDAVFMALKCGPDGGWHCQPDNGTFVLSAGGRILMPDAGNYIYSGDPEGREWFRQTRVHKTLTLDHKNSRYVPRLLQWKPGDKLDILVVENDSYDDLTHRRAVFFVDKTYFVIVDEAIGNATGQLDLHYQLSPGNILAEKDNHKISTTYADGWNVAVQMQPQEGLKYVKEEGLLSSEYLKKEPCPAFAWQIHKKTTEGIRLITVLTPYNTAQAPDVQIEMIEETPVGGTKLRLRVNAGQITEIGYDL